MKTFITWILFPIHTCKQHRNIILNDRGYRITRYKKTSKTSILFRRQFLFFADFINYDCPSYSYYCRVPSFHFVISVNKLQCLKPYEQNSMYKNMIFQDKRKFKEQYMEISEIHVLNVRKVAKNFLCTKPEKCYCIKLPFLPSLVIYQLYRISLTLSSDVFTYKNIPSFGFHFPFLDMGMVRDRVDYSQSPSKCTVTARKKRQSW